MEFTNLIFPLLIVGVFYFMIIRPQSQMRKKQQSFINEMEKGDEVVTSSGILGQIRKIDGNIVTLQIDNKTFIRIAKGYISRELTESVSKGENATA